MCVCVCVCVCLRVCVRERERERERERDPAIPHTIIKRWHIHVSQAKRLDLMINS